MFVGGNAQVCLISTPTSVLFAGDGIIHSKLVDLNSSIFFYEFKSREQRKRYLNEELNRLQQDIQKFTQAALERDRVAAIPG